MNWLLNNPLGNLYGPYFLVLYIALIAVAIGWLLFQHKISIANDSRPPLPVPRQIDPYLFAYLRGSSNEVIRLGFVELLEKGWIEPVKGLKRSTKYQSIAERPKTLDSNPLLAAIFDYFRVAKQPESMFRTNLPQQVKDKAMHWDAWIEKENLKPSSDARFSYRFQSIFLMIALGILGLYKFVVADLHGRDNVIILTVLLVSTPIALFWLGSMRRFTDRGKQFVGDVQSALRPSLMSKDPDVKQRVESELTDSTSFPVYAMGVFGIMALQGTELDAAHRAFQNSQLAAGGSCGASACGSGVSCGGGASCGGGGGGGCGGGGCGGCGAG
jgi:uncharacterized protein (TIGR04222 family)